MATDRGGAEATAELTIQEREAGRVAVLTFSEPRRLNVLSSRMIESAVLALDGLKDDEGVRALILRGAGDRAFIGGADIREMAELEPESARDFITRLHLLCARIRRFPAPTIARVDGYCLGAGLEVAVSCDLIAASERSVFGMPEVKVGVPSVIEAALLPMRIGWGRTRELLICGENVGAATALEWGLVEKLAPAQGLDAAVEEWIEAILKNGPRAVRLQKELIRRWEELALEKAIEAGIESFGRAYETDEPRNLMQRFTQRAD